MALPVAAAAGIAAGAQLLGTGATAYAQGRMNKKTREWNEKMFALQNEQNEEYWHMQNEYNSPTSQMQRMREAGLNPMLMYGQGSSGGGTAGSLDSSSAPSWNPQAPRVDPSGALATYNAWRMQSAQIDNLKAQNTVLIQEATLKAAQTASTVEGTVGSRFSNELATELREFSVEAAKESLRKMQSETDYISQQTHNLNITEGFLQTREAREAALHSANLAEALQRVMLLKAQTLKTEADRQAVYKSIDEIDQNIRIKEMDNQMRDKGIDPGDPGYWRVLMKALNMLGNKATDYPGGGYIKSSIKNLVNPKK